MTSLASTRPFVDVRIATPEDNDALRAVAASCSMDGDMSLRLTREPDFFQLMGIGLDSPIASLFQEFYADVRRNISAEVDFAVAAAEVPAEEWFRDEGADHPGVHRLPPPYGRPR